MQHALAGIRVLDITQVMAGPFCAMQLCDMGADVIKVEPPGGDASRRWDDPQKTDSVAFNGVNRGKRAMVVDLKTPDGAAVVRRLASSCDVLIENHRPGVMARFGLDYSTLREETPALIYASISGYGQTGPEAHKGGFDLIAQGVSGIMSVTGEPGGLPVKSGVPVTDVGAGLLALSGILAALYHRTRSGRGQHVDTSLVESGVAFSVWEASEYFSTGQEPRPCGSAHRLIAPYQAIRCEDGYITVGTTNDRLFSRFSQVLGRPEWIESTEFGSNAQRMNNTDMLVDQIESITTTAPRSHWLGLFEESGVPCGPINSYSEVLTDPQILAREMVIDTTHPTLGPIKSLGTPIKLSETPLDPRRPAPLLGEHTDEILAEIGYDEEAISRLRGLGAVG